MITYELVYPQMISIMNYNRAKLVKHYRIDCDMSLRGVAGHCYEMFGKDAFWEPSWNQLAGVDLCYIMACYFYNNDKDFNEKLWI